ncbi:MAG: class I SAM-dependent methyltransferase [Terriglobia bacterium]
MPGKADYGIDAPTVVRNLFIGGVAALMLPGLLGFHIISLPSKLADVLFSVGAGSGFWLLLDAAIMIASSKLGKLRERDRVLRSIPWRGGERVLDVGCGRGLMLLGAAKRLDSGKAFGIDIWQAVDQSGNRPNSTLENAKAEGVSGRVQLSTADARQMPFPDKSFDVILSNLVIHNIHGKEKRREALREMARVLKAGGRIAILDLAHTGEYIQSFRESGLADVKRSWLRFLIFPPVRLVTATKPRAV